MELESIHKEQSSLVLVENCGEWVVHRCLSCHMYTHALILASTANILVNRALLVSMIVLHLQMTQPLNSGGSNG